MHNVLKSDVFTILRGDLKQTQTARRDYDRSGKKLE
jgi:hypothetical protein